MVKVKVIYEGGIYEDKLYKFGDIFETTEERAKALGDLIEIIEDKSLDKPPEDKMIKKAKKKDIILEVQGAMVSSGHKLGGENNGKDHK